MSESETKTEKEPMYTWHVTHVHPSRDEYPYVILAPSPYAAVAKYGDVPKEGMVLSLVPPTPHDHEGFLDWLDERYYTYPEGHYHLREATHVVRRTARGFAVKLPGVRKLVPLTPETTWGEEAYYALVEAIEDREELQQAEDLRSLPEYHYEHREPKTPATEVLAWIRQYTKASVAASHPPVPEYILGRCSSYHELLAEAARAKAEEE